MMSNDDEDDDDDEDGDDDNYWVALRQLISLWEATLMND